MNRGNSRSAASLVVTTATALSLAVHPVDAKASLFGEENAVLSQIAAQQLIEYVELVEIVQNAVYMVQALNETLAVARKAYQIYDAIRNYTLADLVADAKRGLYEAVPEAKQLEREVGTLVANGRAIRKGSGAFFSRVDIHDFKVKRRAEAVFRHAYRATIWPAVFPGAMDAKGAQPSQVDLLIQERFRRSGEEASSALKSSAMGILAKKVQAYVDDAERKGRADLQMGATTAQVSLQTMSDTNALLDLDRQRTALQEGERLDAHGFNLSLGKTLAESGDLLFGRIRRPTGSGSTGSPSGARTSRPAGSAPGARSTPSAGPAPGPRTSRSPERGTSW